MFLNLKKISVIILSIVSLLTPTTSLLAGRPVNDKEKTLKTAYNILKGVAKKLGKTNPELKQRIGYLKRALGRIQWNKVDRKQYLTHDLNKWRNSPITSTFLNTIVPSLTYNYCMTEDDALSLEEEAFQATLKYLQAYADFYQLDDLQKSILATTATKVLFKFNMMKGILQTPKCESAQHLLNSGSGICVNYATIAKAFGEGLGLNVKRYHSDQIVPFARDILLISGIICMAALAGIGHLNVKDFSQLPYPVALPMSMIAGLIVLLPILFPLLVLTKYGIHQDLLFSGKNNSEGSEKEEHYFINPLKGLHYEGDSSSYYGVKF